MHNTQILKKVSNMRLGVGYPDEQYFVNDENIQKVLSIDKYQNSWLTGLLKCIDYVKTRTTVERMVEIGSYQGESTTLFAHIFQPKELYAVDPFVNGYDDYDGSSTGDFTNVIHNFEERIKKFSCIKHIKDFSYGAVTKFEDNSLDFVYVDGDHTYDGVVRDIKLYLPKIKSGGFIAGHDLGKETVTKAIKNQLGEVDIYFEDSSWVLQVTNRVKNNSRLHTIPNTRIGKTFDQPITANDEDIEFILNNPKTNEQKKKRVEGMLNFQKYFQSRNIKKILQFGAYQGETTELLAKYLKPDIIWTIENFESNPQEISEVVNLQHAEENFHIRTEKYPCVRLLKVDYSTAIEQIIENESIDLVYISDFRDKDHVKWIINHCRPKLKKSGYITGIGWGSGDVVFSCLETIGDVDVYFDDGSWIKQIN
jgi:predicted O-methyltransferase YrrM